MSAKYARIIRSANAKPKHGPLPHIPPPSHDYRTGMRRILIPSLFIAITIIAILFLKSNPVTLNEAADDGDLAKVRKLLNKGYNVNERDSNGYTPLMWVAGDSNRLDIVKALLDKGADVNLRADDGRTPLSISCFLGNTEVVKLLLAKGADVTATNRQGTTPLQQAVTYQRTEIADLLRQYIPKEKSPQASAPEVEIPIEPGTE